MRPAYRQGISEALRVQVVSRHEQEPEDSTRLGTKVSQWPDAPDESKLAPVKHKPRTGDLPRDARRFERVSTPMGVVVNAVGLPPFSCTRPVGTSEWGKEQRDRDLIEGFAKIARARKRR